MYDRSFFNELYSDLSVCSELHNKNRGVSCKHHLAIYLRLDLTSRQLTPLLSIDIPKRANRSRGRDAKPWVSQWEIAKLPERFSHPPLLEAAPIEARLLPSPIAIKFAMRVVATALLE